MARGRWTASFKDRATAQYQADQIAGANEKVRQEAWQAGYAAGFQAGRDSVLNVAPADGPPAPRP